MKILVCHDDSTARDLISIAVTGILDAVVFYASEMNKIDELVGAHSDLNCLISDRYVGGKSHVEILDLLSSKKLEPKVYLFCSGAEEELESDLHNIQPAFISSDDGLDNLIEQLESMGEEKYYYKISLQTLMFSGSLFNYDLYIRLSEQKYVRVLKKGDQFTTAEYSRFSAKKLKFLYLKKLDFFDFLKKFQTDLKKLIDEQAENINTESALEISSSIFDMVQSSLPSLGFTGEVQKIAEANIGLAMAAIKRNVAFNDLFKNSLLHSNGYINDHSTLLIYIACKLSSEMSWDSEVSHFKLSLAAFLHDITIQDDKLAQMNTMEELYKAGYSEEIITQYTRHPDEIAKLVSKMDNFPGDIDNIILQHHETPAGDGFPNQINHTKISPMSALFMVAHDIASRVSIEREAFNLEKYIADSQSVYSRGHFKKIFDKLVAIMNESDES